MYKEQKKSIARNYGPNEVGNKRKSRIFKNSKSKYEEDYQNNSTDINSNNCDEHIVEFCIPQLVLEEENNDKGKYKYAIEAFVDPNKLKELENNDIIDLLKFDEFDISGKFSDDDGMEIFNYYDTNQNYKNYINSFKYGSTNVKFQDSLGSNLTNIISSFTSNINTPFKFESFENNEKEGIKNLFNPFSKEEKHKTAKKDMENFKLEYVDSIRKNSFIEFKDLKEKRFSQILSNNKNN